MKVRVYHDERKKYRDCVDAWSIVFMTPQRLREGYTDDRGLYLGCSPSNSNDYLIRCTWEPIKYDARIGVNLYLGKRIPLDKCPDPIRIFAQRAERIYNRYINNKDPEYLDPYYDWINL